MRVFIPVIGSVHELDEILDEVISSQAPVPTQPALPKPVKVYYLASNLDTEIVPRLVS